MVMPRNSLKQHIVQNRNRKNNPETEESKLLTQPCYVAMEQGNEIQLMHKQLNPI